MGVFAERLWRLKLEAGDPSFAEMASRLGARASKSSLASATKGRTLPSWGTTWEFVRVLAVEQLERDPQETEREWRAEWERAKALSIVDGAVLDGAESGPAVEHAWLAKVGFPHETALEETDPAAPVHRPPARRDRRSRRREKIAALAAFPVLTLAAFAFVHLDTEESPGSSESKAPPPATSTKPAGDDSRFEGDITYPDGTLVPQGELFTKVWRLRNAGTITWRGRFLARINSSPCHAPKRVAIPMTSPGHTVDIEVEVRAPKRTARCIIYWRMVDAYGFALMPDKRPIFLDVRV